MRTDIAQVDPIEFSSRLKTVFSSIGAFIYSPGWPLVIGITVAAVYLVLLPYIERTWRATGDEPHYLLTAHSLVADLDFDLTNNYDQLDYLAFYFSRDIDPQIRTNAAGQQILDHQLGLPVIIAPAYALGGRWGVLACQAILGGLLAALTFKLAAFVSRDERASLLATLLIALSPPLLMYHYLVYPELIGALLTTLVLYFIISRSQPTPAIVAVVILSLLALPWLNRRFVPLAVVLALLIVWAWRQKSIWFGVLGLLTTLVSIFLLGWFHSQLDQPVRADIIAPPEASVFWSRLGRGIGWLLDQQRGLFIFAPIYIFTLWGLPLVIYDSYRHSSRHWLVVIPFLVSLSVTILAAGYYVAWELGPRSLVVALPALAPLLALAWRYYGRHKVWVGLSLVLVALSLVNSLVILRNPELPYKSSLPIFYADKLGWPWPELLPDLAGHARVSPGQATTEAVVIENGEPVWFAEAGGPVTLAKSDPLGQLPFGHYRLTWPVRVEPGLPPATELMRLSANFLGGGPLFNQVVTAADLPQDGSYGLVKYVFFNPNVDRWRTPLVFRVVSTGQSDIRGKDIIFSPQPFFAWFLPYFYLLLIGAGAFVTWSHFRSGNSSELLSDSKPLFVWPGVIGWGLLLVVSLGTFGFLLYQNNQNARTYDVTRLYHLVGQRLDDPTASDGRGWLVDPLVDPPQKAVYGPFDIYDRGEYHIAFRMKLAQVANTDQPVVYLRVTDATDAALFTQPIRADHFSEPDRYHDFVLVVDNPRRQALSFEVDYLGVAALVIDEVTITELNN
jgi:hypothetical protein